MTEKARKTWVLSLEETVNLVSRQLAPGEDGLHDFTRRIGEAPDSEILEFLGARYEVESAQISIPYAKLGELLGNVPLAVVHADSGLVIVKGRSWSGRYKVMTRGGGTKSVSLLQVADMRQIVRDRADSFNFPKFARATRRDLEEFLTVEMNIDVTIFRPASSAGVWALVRTLKPIRTAILLAALSGVAQSMSLVAWLFAAHMSVTTGLLDPRQLWGWIILLVAAVPIGAVSEWISANFAIRITVLFKRYLFAGVLDLPLQTVKRRGAGDLVAHAQQFEGIEGAFASLPPAFVGMFGTTIAALALLWTGDGAIFLVPLFLALLAALGYLAWRLIQVTLASIDSRLGIRIALTETVTGYLTLKTQGDPKEELSRQDDLMARHLGNVRRVYRTTELMGALAGLFLPLGLAATVMTTENATPQTLVIGLAGLFLGASVLNSADETAGSVATVVAAWTKLKDIFKSPVQNAPEPPLEYTNPTGAGGTGPIVQVSNLIHRYKKRDSPVLRGVTLELRAQDKIVLRGKSGGGKSTLAEVLAGLQDPVEGLVLVGGADKKTLGELGWSRWVALAPQFHQNHIFNGSLLYNLLLGRRWPAEPKDIELARQVCKDLGLESLIQKMSRGMHEPVGQNGWALSHGEKSRVFLARALLAETPVMILDESVSALDPETLETVMERLNQDPRTIVLLAHP